MGTSAFLASLSRHQSLYGAGEQVLQLQGLNQVRVPDKTTVIHLQNRGDTWKLWHWTKKKHSVENKQNKSLKSCTYQCMDDERKALTAEAAIKKNLVVICHSPSMLPWYRWSLCWSLWSSPRPPEALLQFWRRQHCFAWSATKGWEKRSR